MIMEYRMRRADQTQYCPGTSERQGFRARAAMPHIWACPDTGRERKDKIMSFKSIATGLQHIGIPTNDIEGTIAFYAELGFDVAHRANNGGEQVAFLRLGDLTVETYQNGRAVGRAGAVDHVAINVTDVKRAREIADRLGLEVIEAGRLPFWQNGVEYFTVLGPNREKLEFNQYL